ncbi:hypothetical protein GCM10010359_56230 [Streptomyces morookaense]|nr:hypothetical protein GCM10010359_56230 [Streptomyces morookaense]
METIGARARPLRSGQFHFGVEVVAVLPGGTQPLEDGAVVEGHAGEPLVEAVDVDGLRARGRPRGERAVHRARGRGQRAGGVPHPRQIRVLGARVHGQRPAARAVVGADAYLQGHASALGYAQRCLEGEFFEQVAAHGVGRGDRQLDERGARQQDDPAHGVIGQPRVGVQREPPGEQLPVAVGQRHGGAEQRVPGLALAHGPQVARRGGGVEPVAVALEGVGGQGDPAGAGEQRLPVRGDAVGVELPEGGDGGLRLGAVGTQHRHRDRLVRARLHQGAQHAAGADLHEGGHAQVAEGLHTVGEAHGFADVPDPVLGGVRLRQLTGQVGHDRDLRLVERQIAHDRRELVEHGVHQRRVEGVAHRQPGRLATLLAEDLGYRRCGILGTRNHHGPRAVDGGDTDLLGEVRQDFLFRGLHRHHRATRRQRLHQRSTRRHQLRRIRQRQHTRHMRGSDLADRVTGHAVGPDVPGLQQPEKRHFDGEEGGLGHARPVQLLRVDVQRHPEVCTHLVVRGREDRVRGIQLPSHAEALRALAREQEGDLALGAGPAQHEVGRGFAGREGGQCRPQFLTVGADQRCPVLQPGTGHGEREADVGQRCRAVGGGQQPFRLGAQRRLGPAGQHPRHGHRAVLLRRLGGGDGGRLLDDGVRVGAADAERGHGSPARQVSRRPLHGLGQQPHGPGRPVDVRGRLVDVQRLRQHTVPHRHDHLDDARHTRGGLRVTDVGLDGAEPQRPVLRSLLAVGGDEGLRLDRVAQLRTRAVCLDGVHVGGRQAGRRQRLPDHPLLRRTVRCRQAVGGTVLVDRRAPDDRQHLVPVAAGVGEPLDEEQAHAFAPARAVRTGRERLAAAVRRQAALAAELHEHVRRGHHGDTADEGHGALAAAQRLHRQVQRHQRRRTGRVHGDRRALQPERVGDAAGDDRGRLAGEGITLDLLRGVAQSVGVVLAVGADEDTGPAGADGRGGDARALEGLPGRLQQQALLRVHRQGLARRDAEEAGVEAVGSLDEAAFAGVRPAGPVGVRVVERTDVPAAVGGEPGHRVAAGPQQFPQVLRRLHAAGEAAAHADDRDRLVGHDARDLPGVLLLPVPAEEFLAQVAGEGGGGRVVEDQRGGQFEAGGRVEPVAQFDGGERVEAGLAERPVGVEGALAGVAEHGGGLLADKVQQDPVLFPRCGAREAPAQCGRGHLGAPRVPGQGLEGLAGLGHAEQQRGRAGGGEDGDEAVPVDVRDGHGRLAVGQRTVEHGEGGFGREGPDAAPPQVVAGGAVGHAAVRPGSPRDGQRGQAGRAALLGEGVEERVRGTVGALAAVAPDAGHRGEQHEGVEVVPVPGELVQVERGGRLGAEHVVQPFGRERFDEAVVEHARGVHHGVHGVPVEQLGQRGPVGRVARGDGDADARLLQFRGEFGGAGGVGATAAGEQQVFGSGGGEPAGHVPAERTRAAGHEHRAARRPIRLGRCRVLRCAHQTPAGDARGADGELVLVGLGQQAGQPLQRAGVGVGGQVDEPAPPLRLLQGDDPAQAPDLCGGGVGERVGGAGRHRAAGHAPQRGLGPGVAEGLDEQNEPLEGIVPRRGEQHAFDLSGLGEHPGQRRTVGVLGQDQRDDFRTELGEPGTDRTRPRGLLRDREQPGPRRNSLDVAERLPGDAVAPAVGGGLLAPLPAPAGQLGRDHVQLGGRQPQEGAEGLVVLALDEVPELGVQHARGAGGRHPGGIEPVALALERVGGQGDLACAGEEGVPVRGDAVGVELPEGGDGGLRLGTVATQDGDGDGTVHAALDEGAQDAAGADLDEGGHTELVQGLHTVGETDRLADMSDPVLGRVRLRQLAGQVRNDRDVRLVEGQPVHDGGELVEHGVHQRRVERVAHRQPGRLAALLLERLRDRRRGVLGTRNHHGPRAVDRSDTHLVGEVRQDLLFRGLHGHHRAAGRQCLHQRSTRRHQLRRILQRQHTRHMSRSNLAHRVTGHVVRPDAPRLQQPEQRHLDGEQRRLGEAGLVQLLRVHIDRGIEKRAHLVVRRSEHRVRRVQLPPHAQALRALAREEEAGLAAGRASERHVRRRPARGQRGQSGPQFLRVGAGHRGPVLQRGPGRGQREADVGERGVVRVVQGGQQPLGLPLQRRLALRRQHPGHRPCRGLDSGGLLARGDVLDDDVRVGAADAEGRHGRPARPGGAGPFHRLGQQPHAARRPVDVRGRLVRVQGLRQHAVLHRHHHLDHTGDTGGRLRVTDVGLQRAQPQRPFVVPVLAVGGDEGFRLDGVAQARARAVRLHRVHIGRRQSGRCQGLADDALLRRAVRRRQTVRGTVLVDGGSADHGQDAVPVALGVAEPLHQEHADALGPAGAVGAGGERLAAAVGRQAALAAELDEHAGRGHDGDTAGQGHRALAVAQRLDGEVQRDQGRRAGRVHGDGRAFEAERVGHAARGDAGGGAGQQVALDALHRFVQPGAVVLCRRADEDAGPAAAQRGRVDAGALEGLPCGLQDEPLLGVDRGGLAGADAEEGGVELGGLVQESALPGGGLAGRAGLRVVERFDVPATVGGESGDGVAAGGHQPPQVLGRADPAGEAAAHGHDGDRLVGVGRGAVDGGGRRPALGLGGQVAGECGRGRVVVEQSAGQAQSGGLGELVAQFHRAEGVEAEVLERPLGLDLAGVGVAQDGGDVGADQVEDGGVALVLREGGQSLGEGADGSSVAVGLAVGLLDGRQCGDGGHGGRGLVQPVPLPLERVRRQIRPACAAAGEQGGPVRFQAVDVQGGDRCQQGLCLGAPGAQGRYEQGVGGCAGAGQGGQDAAGAEFQAGADAVFVEPGDAVGEADRVPDVADPVLGGAALVCVGEPAGHVGDDRDARGVEGQALGHAAELRQHGFHVRGVEGVADAQPAGLATEGRAGVGDLRDEVVVAGDDDGVGAVQCGDAHAVPAVADERADLVLGALDGDHGSPGGEFLHEAAACGDECAGVGEGEHAGHVCGGEFADGVAHEHVGGDAPALQQAEEGDLDGEQRGLGVEGAVEFGGLRGVLGGEHDLAQRPGQAGVEVGAHLVECGGELREGPGQFAAHAGPLAALAGEEEGGPAARCDAARGQGGVDAAVGQLAQGAQEVRAVLADDDGPVVEVGAAGGERVADVGQGEAGAGLGVREQGGGLGAQSGCGLGGQRPEGGRGVRPGAFRLVGGLLVGGLVCGEHDVAVGAAHAEGADAGEQRAAVLAFPRGVFGLHPEVQPGQRDGGVGGLEVQAGGQFAVAEGQGGLEQAGDAGGAFEVADVGLGRADPQRLCGVAVRAEHGAEGGRLDRVADLGAGAVQFDVSDVGGVDPGALVGEPQHLLLAGLQGDGQPVAAAVVVDGAAADHAVDPVAVRDGLCQRLEDDDAAALAADVAVGAGVEGEAPAVRGQAAELGGAQRAFGDDVEVDAARERDRGLALAEALAGQVDRHQGGGLAGIDRQAGAVEAEEVRDPVGDDAAVQAGDGVRGDGREPGAVVEGGVVVPDRADEHAGPGGAQRLGARVRVLQRFPGQFQHEPLLRVHGRGLLGREPEEAGVEVADAVEESAAADVRPARSGGVGVGDRVPVPAVRGHIGDRVGTLAEQPPEGGRVGGPRQPAGETDDGDAVGRIRRIRRTSPIPSPVEPGLDHVALHPPTQRTKRRHNLARGACVPSFGSPVAFRGCGG